MISPFDDIDKAIKVLKEVLQTYNTALQNPQYDQKKEPKWFKCLVKRDNLILIEKFKKYGHKTAASFFAEVITGATPSKGCDECPFFHIPFGSQSISGKKRCNLTGDCTPLLGKECAETTKPRHCNQIA